MPNSSARCAQLPRAVDKVPFYSALKKFRDYLRGEVPDFNESEVVFPEVMLPVFFLASFFFLFLFFSFYLFSNGITEFINPWRILDGGVIIVFLIYHKKV